MSLRRSGDPRRAATWALLALCGLAPGRPVAAQAPKVSNNPETRYNLVERFTTRDGDVPGYVGQYQVAYRETLSSQNMETKGYTSTVQFSERPAAVGPDERMVSEVIRHYDSFKVTPEPPKRGAGPKPLDDLTVWCRDVPGQAPLIISMTPNRPLQVVEYFYAINNHYVHRLTLVLPDQPVRVGDTWRVGRVGTGALTNLMLISEGSLAATLAEVRAHPKGVGLQAVIDVKGKLRQATDRDNETTVNARLLFAFTPPQAAAGADPAVIDGYGAIEKASLAQVTTNTESNKAKRPSIKREFVLERRFPGEDPPLAIPKTPPAPTPENSWLTLADDKGRFHFRHPQRYEHSPKSTPDFLVIAAEGVDELDDVVYFDHRPLGAVRPDDEFQKLKKQWQAGGVKVSGGQSKKLPEADWPGMVVYHMDAILTQDEGEGRPAMRRYFDNYVFQFARNETIVVSATTFTPKYEEFRKELEAMLKTLKLGAPPSR